MSDADTLRLIAQSHHFHHPVTREALARSADVVERAEPILAVLDAGGTVTGSSAYGSASAYVPGLGSYLDGETPEDACRAALDARKAAS